MSIKVQTFLSTNAIVRTYTDEIVEIHLCYKIHFFICTITTE